MKEKPPPLIVIIHEVEHIKQGKEEGLIKFLFKYLLCFPLWYNKYRWNWEMEAYKVQYKNTFIRNPEQAYKRISAILRGKTYGWLRNG